MSEVKKEDVKIDRERVKAAAKSDIMCAISFLYMLKSEPDVLDTMVDMIIEAHGKAQPLIDFAQARAEKREKQNAEKNGSVHSS